MKPIEFKDITLGVLSMLGRLKKMKILIIDREGEFNAHFKSIFLPFKDQGRTFTPFLCEFFSATDLQSAINTNQNIHPDLVLINTDIGLQESKEICQFIRGNEGQRHTGVILISFDDNVEIEENLALYLEIGADDVIRPGCSAREIRARTNSVLKLKAMTDELRSANHKLKRLSNTDELTGLNNMRSFNSKYLRALKECKNSKTGIGVIMIDLDHFKLVNDKTNHLMGSHVISEVGKIIATANILATEDCAARFGGDEYVIFTRDADLDAVAEKAETLRKLIQASVFIKDGKSIRITASMGVSWVRPGFIKGNDEDPIKAADMMLYKSKDLGRNLVSKIELTEKINLQDIHPEHRIAIGAK